MFLKRYINKLIDMFKTKNPPLYYIEGNNPYMNVGFGICEYVIKM